MKNRANETEIDIVDRALDRYGRPERTSETRGRFIARVNGFLDPAVYTAGREITVGGTVQGKLTRSIGEYSYTYIVVAADATKLWEPRLPPSYYRSPFYSPFYDPFWPRPFYPWYGPYPFYPY